MDSQSPKAPRMRQARKSIAHLPSQDLGGNKENATMDLAAFSTLTSKDKQPAKKLRSKSIGPGGLDVLKESGGNKGGPTLPQVKSILKPTIHFSPPKAIPPRSIRKDGSPGKTDDLKAPEVPPTRSPTKRSAPGVHGADAEFFAIPSRASGSSQLSAQSPTRVALRTEEEQQAAVREKERQEMLAHKDARRKSLANRRVSFAPEATLHTWNVVELPEDSTTSSASTNSTRRASGLTANTGSPYAGSRSSMPSSDASKPPSTPPEQVEEMQVAASPAHQRDLHQKKRRRSSAIPPMNFNDPSQLSSSPYSGDSGDDSSSQAFETADEGNDSSDSEDKDLVEDETVTNVDGDDNTMRSNADSTGSSGRLEVALQQAAKQAGTQGIAHDEHGDCTMEMADDEVTNAFKPWMSKGKQAQPAGDPSALLDQENVNPFSPAFKANTVKETTEEDDGTMEITQAVGGIIPAIEDVQGSPMRHRRKSIAGPNRRTSNVLRRRSSGDASSIGGDETMDLTTAIGGIQEDYPQREADSVHEDEDLTMEFTSVVEGVVQSSNKGSDANPKGQDHTQTFQDNDPCLNAGSANGEEDMDFTNTAGGILLPSITERTEPPEDQTMDMDITTAVGAILPKPLSTGSKTEAKELMEREIDVGQLSVASPFHNGSAQEPMGAGLHDERPLPTQARKAMMASDTGSPSVVASQARNSAGKNVGQKQSLTPRPRQASPVKKPGTPSKQLTPQPSRPITPGKTPPSKNAAMRTASPKKLFKAEIKSAKKADEDTGRKPNTPNPLFHYDPVTGASTPSVVLKPRRRRSSGLGIDREGLGSPVVAALLDRRGSIGENAKAFVAPGNPPAGVRFEDPRIMEQQVDQERAEEKRKESGRSILQDEADEQDLEEKDATTNLKDMIESLTPQKKKLNGRKSLHVGAAKGLLGKRPAELDDDEDKGATPKRLIGSEGSPIKKVKLPAPPSKAATTGRLTRSTRLSLAESAGNTRPSTSSRALSPRKSNNTPKDQSRFKDTEAKSPAKVTPFEEKLDGAEFAGHIEEDDRVHLQDFLNMTSIRFMELTTTKRRHTVVPNAIDQSAQKAVRDARDSGQPESSNDLENCVVAGACTVPMLELYQHSCRELKNYISEGRKVAKEIEEATYEDNPPLFREYMSAPPDVKPIMDNQFKNVKTNARLLSKAMWYEWRMKLLDGLKEGLMTIGQGMEEDARSLTQQEQILQPVLPGLMEEHGKLESQIHIAQVQVDELAGCNQEELQEARDDLVSLEQDLEAKRAMVEELQNQLRESEDRLEETLARKQECTDEIKEAEKVRTDCQGWGAAEVLALQTKVNELEASHGWTITSASGLALTMTYNGSLQLFFKPSSFLPNDAKMEASASENAPISLSYIADANEHHPQSLSTEKRFFLQIIRAQLQCLQQSHTKTKDLLAFVGRNWKTACSIAEEAVALGVSYITEPTILADEVMAVRSIILLRAMRTKVEVAFEVKVRSGEGANGLSVSVKSKARVCYGETLNEKKMSEFLESKVKGAKGYGIWARAIKELEERLIARGRKS